jgi:hypothetical protein
VSSPQIVEVSIGLKVDSTQEDQFVLMRLMTGLVRAFLVLLLATGLSSCERAGTSLAEPQYQAALVGDWQGNVGDDSESISFEADGSFSCQVRSNGFIGTTLGQGTTGAIRGSWTLQGNIITLAIDHASQEQPLNLATTSTIVSFNQNQLVVKSDTGETSTFTRVM